MRIVFRTPDIFKIYTMQGIGDMRTCAETGRTTTCNTDDSQELPPDDIFSLVAVSIIFVDLLSTFSTLKMKLRRFLLRYYPPGTSGKGRFLLSLLTLPCFYHWCRFFTGITLEYEQGGLPRSKTIDLLNLTRKYVFFGLWVDNCGGKSLLPVPSGPILIV
jgi:hypothetical protein